MAEGPTEYPKARSSLNESRRHGTGKSAGCVLWPQLTCLAKDNGRSKELEMEIARHSSGLDTCSQEESFFVRSGNLYIVHLDALSLASSSVEDLLDGTLDNARWRILSPRKPRRAGSHRIRHPCTPKSFLSCRPTCRRRIASSQTIASGYDLGRTCRSTSFSDEKV